MMQVDEKRDMEELQAHEIDGKYRRESKEFIDEKRQLMMQVDNILQGVDFAFFYSLKEADIYTILALAPTTLADWSDPIQEANEPTYWQAGTYSRVSP
jgi:hypothetical protein